MLNWIRKLRSNFERRRRRVFLCSVHRDLAGRQACPACEGYTRGYAEAVRIEKRRAKRAAFQSVTPRRTALRKQGPRRYDEVNRDKARPRKAAHSV